MPSRSGERNLHRDIMLRVVRLYIPSAVLGPELVEDLRRRTRTGAAAELDARAGRSRPLRRRRRAGRRGRHGRPLTDDAWLTMPPEPYEYRGSRDAHGVQCQRDRRVPRQERHVGHISRGRRCCSSTADATAVDGGQPGLERPVHSGGTPVAVVLGYVGQGRRARGGGWNERERN